MPLVVVRSAALGSEGRGLGMAVPGEGAWMPPPLRDAAVSLARLGAIARSPGRQGVPDRRRQSQLAPLRALFSWWLAAAEGCGWRVRCEYSATGPELTTWLRCSCSCWQATVQSQSSSQP